jgi:hypothetical protein
MFESCRAHLEKGPLARAFSLGRVSAMVAGARMGGISYGAVGCVDARLRLLRGMSHGFVAHLRQS